MHTVSRLARRIGGVGQALILLVLLGYAGQVTADPLLDPLRDFFIRHVSRFVTRSLKGSFEVGALRGSLLGAPVLQNITLRDEQGVVVAQIAELRLVYDLKALLNKRLEIHTAEIVKPQLTLVQEPDGSINLLNLLSPAEPSSEAAGGTAFTIVIDSLHIRAGHVVMRLPALQGIEQLERLEARLSARLDATGLTLQMHDLSAHASPADVMLRTLQGTVQTQDGTVQMQDVRLQTEQTTVRVDGVLPGTAPQGAAPETQLTLQMQPLDLTEVGRLRANPTIQGQVHLALQASGPQEALQVRGEASAATGHIMAQAVINAAATPPSYHGTLAINNLDLATLMGQAVWNTDINLHLALDGAGVTPPELHSTLRLEILPSRVGDMRLDPSQLHLAISAQHVQVHRLELHTSVAHTTASGTYDLSGIVDLQYAVTADLGALQRLVGMANLAGDLQTQGQVRGTWADLQGQGTLQMQHLRYDAHRVDFLRLTYDGSQLGSQPQITAHLQARDAQVGTLPIAQVGLDATYQGSDRQVRFALEVVQSATGGGQARGTVTQDATGQQVVLDEFQVRLPERTWQAAAPLQVAFGPQRLEITQLHLTHAEESIVLSGALQGEKLHDLRLQVTQLDLSFWQRLLQLPPALSGRATLQAELTGTRTEPLLQADLTMQPEAAQQLPFSAYHNTLTYAQRQLQSWGRVYQDNREVVELHVRLPTDLAFTDVPLAQRLSAGPVALHMQLRQPNLAAVQQWQPTLPRLSGTVQGTLDLQGTYTALNLDASVQLQQLGIEGMVAQMQAPVYLQGAFVTAPSLADLVQAIEQRQLTPQMPSLVLRMPALDGLVLVSAQETTGPQTAPQTVQKTRPKTESRSKRKTRGSLTPREGLRPAPTQSRQGARQRNQAPQPPLNPLPKGRALRPSADPVAAEGRRQEPVQVRNFVLQASAQWTPGGPQGTLERLELQASGLGLPRTEAQLAARWTPQRLDLTRLHLRAAQSEVRGQGFVTLLEQQVQFRFDIPRLDLSQLPLGLPPHLPPIMQGVLSVRGTPTAPQVEARLQYAGGQISADLSAQLQDPLPRYQAALRIDGLALAQVLPQAQGTLQARAQLQGIGMTAEQRRATLAATLETTGFNLAPGLTAQMQAAINGTGLRLDQLQVRSTPVTVTASGTLAAASQATLQYRVTLGDLSSLQPLLGMPLQASGGLAGEVQGPLHDLRTRGTLQLDAWRVADVRGERLQATFTATQIPAAPQASLQAQIRNVQGPSLPPSSLRVEGTYAAQQGRFTVAVTDGPYQHTRVAGTVDLLTEQRLRLQTLRLQHQELVWENVAPVEVARSPQGTVQIQRLHLRSGAQSIVVQGTLDPQGPIRAEVQAQNLLVRPTARAFAPDLDLPDGRLDLALSLSGTVQQPQMQSTLRLAALQWHEQQLGEVQATAGLSGNTAQTELRWQAQGREIVQARGSMRLDTAGPLDLRLQVPVVDLAILDPLSTAVTESAGTLSLDLQVSGTRQQPQAHGALLVRDGVLQLSTTGERYQGIQTRVTFAGNRITIEQLQVGSRTGPLQMTGWVEHAGLALRRIDVTIEAHNFTAVHTAMADAMVSAQAAVRGSQQEVAIVGHITVPRAHVRMDKLPGTGVKTVEPWELTVPGVYGPGPKAMGVRPGEPQTAAPQATLIPALRADIRVDMPRNVWIQGAGTAIELSGNMHARKVPDAPLILYGSLETVRGYASYYGKRFTVERGQVTFTGTPEINPRLDVVVTQEITDYRVFIQIAGTAQEPQVTLRSTPELPQTDIISLLVLGKTTADLTKSERGSLAETAQQLAGGFVASELERVLAPSLGLETIEITTGSVRVGRYVAKDLFLSIGREFGEEDSGTTAGLEYSITRRLKVRGSSSERGETALDFLWRLDY